MRRVWIEMQAKYIIRAVKQSHPPCGGCGLKFQQVFVLLPLLQSPSMRRVWIEISGTRHGMSCATRHPPCGGCGLKWSQLVHGDGVATVTLHAEGVD